MESHTQCLLISGTILFLFGLLIGFAVPAVRNPRMGVSAHLVGVQCGIALWAFGLMWPRLHLPAGVLTPLAVLAVVSMYGNWAGVVLAAVWGTNRATPIAGAGHQASRGKEALVMALLAGSSIALVVVVLVLLWGLIAAR